MAKQQYTQASAMPTQKVAAGTLAGAITFLAMWVINTYTLLPGDQILPAEAGSAITTIIGAFVAWVVPPASRDQVVPKQPTPAGGGEEAPQM